MLVVLTERRTVLVIVCAAFGSVKAESSRSDSHAIDRVDRLLEEVLWISKYYKDASTSLTNNLKVILVAFFRVA